MLKVAPDQEDYVASNLYSIAESKFEKYTQMRAVSAGKKLVGFVMWESLKDEGKPHCYLIYRFMIAARFQAKGYGRKAIELVLAEITQDRCWEKISVCVVPDNHSAQHLYRTLGFVEQGLDDEGELIFDLLPGNY